MSEWKDYKLKDLTTKIGSGATPTGGGNAYKMEGLSLIRSQNVLDLKFSNNGLALIDDEQADGLRNVTVYEDDILLNITGDSVARVCKVPKDVLPARVNQHVSIIRSDVNKIDSNFLLYYLQSIKEFLLSISEIGGTRRALTKAMLENLIISMPELSEQCAIASILSSLDDKIDLLHRQNKTLEQLAETLFRQWFVEEADSNWEKDSLGNYITVVDNRGKTPPISQALTEYPLIEANSLNGESRLVNYSVIKKYVDSQTFQTWFRDHLRKYDILITTVGANIGAMAMYVLERGNIAQNIIGLSVKKISPFYLYQTLKNKIDEILQLDIGGVQPSIKVPHLLSLLILIPPKETEQKFVDFIKPVMNKMENTYLEISTLESLRDTLLPKLMSGEVRVS